MSIIGDTATSYKGVPIIWSDQIRQIRKDARDNAIREFQAIVDAEAMDGAVYEEVGPNTPESTLRNRIMFNMKVCGKGRLITKIDDMLEEEKDE